METWRILRLRRPHHGGIGILGGGILQNQTMSSDRDLFFIFLSEHAVSDCRNVVPTTRRGCIQNTHPQRA